MRLPLSRAFPALAVFVILVATLWPNPDARAEPWVACIVCGEHGVADVLRNIILFLPLGAALALGDWALVRAVLAGALLSAAVEGAQIYIPGRDPSLGDVLSNTLGTALGCALLRAAPLWLLPQRRSATRLLRIAALTAAAACVATGALLSPALPDSFYYGMWRPVVAQFEPYHGTVLDATIGTLHISPGPIDDRALVQQALQAPEHVAIGVRALAGPRPGTAAPLFAIFDDRQREIVVLAIDRDDLVLRLRTRAEALQLDQPDIRFVNGVRHIALGDTLDAAVLGGGGSGRGYRMVVNGRSQSGLGPTVGSGWAMLMYPETMWPWVKTLFDALWIGAVFLPLGFWIRTRGDALVGISALAAGLLGAPVLTHLVRTPTLEWAGAVAGILAGLGLHVAISARLGGMPLDRSARGPAATAWTSADTQRSIRE